jgi:hypothetical protein
MSESIPFEQSVGYTAAVSGDDAIPMPPDQVDEILDRLQTRAFHTGAPAPQILGGVTGMLITESLEVLTPVRRTRGRQLRRRTQ